MVGLGQLVGGGDHPFRHAEDVGAGLFAENQPLHRAENPADGFISQQAISANWKAFAIDKGPGTYRVVYEVEDWRGNIRGGTRTFFVNSDLCKTVQPPPPAKH